MSGQFVEIGGLRVDISQFDFSNTSSRVGNVRSANIILITLVVLVVSLRLFARTKFVKRVFLDDTTQTGLGTHIWLLPRDTLFEDVKRCILLLLVCQILYALAIALTKIAIISSYLRFIQNTSFRIVMYSTLFVTLGLLVCGIFVPIFQCNPVSGAWEFDAKGSCINYVDYLYASSAVNVFTDIVLCALPVPHLWRLNMPLKQRIVLCVLFAGGAGACVAGIARIAYLGTLRVLDVPYQSVPSLNLSVIECSIGIICVSIPALRPLVARIFPNASRATQSSMPSTKPDNSRGIPLGSITSITSGFPRTARLPSERDSDTRSLKRISTIEERHSIV
ncbi:hypothetical protein DE146DRAFT_604726 [Phaeosphaeria sp. MPI-PUGE-AT-0046c]|nr:hypothetical protein DE146DRAFT_604726 [Phaeosphaeria sp. MPI-PUGE-AT-0046c]